MDKFLEAIRIRADDQSLRNAVQESLSTGPSAAPRIAQALASAHHQGSITTPQFQALMAVVNSARPGLSAAPTQHRQGDASVPPETRLRAVEKVSAGSSTESRLEDPHTWTLARDEPCYPGRVLGRRYQLERKIGEGGMGVVYLARDLIEADFSEHPFVAIKVLKPNFREHPDALKALHEEVRKSRTLSHPNIVTVYTFDRDASVVFMTMEYLEGKPLNLLIEDEYARGMPLNRAWPIIEGAGLALAYAHDRGVVHSDFKPSNVFVLAAGRPKVLDFGIARAVRHGSGQRFDASSLGALTELYASCEMLRGEAVDPRDDVFAFACVVYELLSGRHPFGSASAVEASDAKVRVAPIKTLTRGQNKALVCALAFERKDRTESIEKLIDAMKRAAPRRRLFLVMAMATLLGAAILGAGWWTYTRYAAPDESQQLVNSLLKPNAEDASNVDPDELKLLLEQGDDYLAQANEHFDPALLSEGVSTAYGAYHAVLKLDSANRVAAERIAEIVRIYVAQARALRKEGQFKRAAAIAGYALKIDPNRESLKKLEADLERESAADPKIAN